MKVTVNFDTVRVVVPCGDGQLLVSQVIDHAVARYCKAVGKSADSWVFVHNLRAADGGILDPDDTLVDVVDDREQLTAFYEIQGECSTHRQNGGDGTSSGGTTSPDVFHSQAVFNAAVLRAAERKGLNMADTQLIADSLPSVKAQKSALKHPLPPSSRQTQHPSVIPTINKFEDEVDGVAVRLNTVDGQGPTSDVETSSVDSSQQNAAFYAFARHPARKSLTNNAAMLNWLDAQERLQEKYEDEEDTDRKEPIGSSDEAEMSDRRHSSGCLLNGVTHTNRAVETGILLMFENPGGPLGIHVIPGADETGRNTGLIVHSIEPSSQVDRDGRLHVGDRVIEINGRSLVNIDFPSAQDIFRNALRASVIKLRVVSSHRRQTSPPAPILKKDHVHFDDVTDGPLATSDKIKQPTLGSNSPSQKTPPAVPSRSSSTLTKGSKFAPISSTRLIGKVMKIELTKGSQGLGFSVTTRDNLAGGNNPIYIKNILPQGAAVSSGQLQPGDRLLQVNGIEMTGKSQDDVVSVLRGIKVGEVVTLTISRNDADDTSSHGSNEIQQSASNSNPDIVKTSTDLPKRSETNVGESFSRGRSPAAQNFTPKAETMKQDENHNIVAVYDVEYVELSIAVSDATPDTSSLLGVSIKGMTHEQQDIGLFIKGIIDGGAAAKDGRLRLNDQLVSLNGIQLTGQTNSERMTILKQALRRRGSVPGCVDIVVARRTSPPGEVASPCQEQLLNIANKFADSLPSPNEPNVRLSNTTRRPSKSVLRNMSYQIANGDLSVSDQTVSELASTPSKLLVCGGTAPTINGGRGDTVLIETELHQPSPQFKSQVSAVNSVANNGHPVLLSHCHDVTIDSCDSSPVDIDPSTVFSREAAGRQSMSEKRKAYMDPRVTAFYEQVKTVRGANMKKCQSEESLRPVDPLPCNEDDTMNVRCSLHRCCSLESVQMALHDDIQHINKRNSKLPSVMRRTRACNESFRAAVDRSYNRRLAGLDNKTDNTGRDSAGYPSRNQVNIVSAGPDKKSSKKQKGLLKTFGDVFRFGKARNAPDRMDKPSSVQQPDIYVSGEKNESKYINVRQQENEVLTRSISADGCHGNNMLASTKVVMSQPSNQISSHKYARHDSPMTETVRVDSHRPNGSASVDSNSMPRYGRMVHAKSEFSVVQQPCRNSSSEHERYPVDLPHYNNMTRGMSNACRAHEQALLASSECHQLPPRRQHISSNLVSHPNVPALQDLSNKHGQAQTKLYSKQPGPVLARGVSQQMPVIPCHERCHSDSADVPVADCGHDKPTSSLSRRNPNGGYLPAHRPLYIGNSAMNSPSRV